MIDQNKLKEIFEYRDGSLYWKIQYGSRGLIGKKVGSLHPNGYLQTKLNNKRHLIHRLIFLMHYGYVPKILDHIDGNRLNNCIENLRETTASQNQFNTGLCKNNKSGYKNVQWVKNAKKWRVRLILNKKDKVFGYFDDVELAGLVAEEARNKHHKEFAKHF